MCSQVWIEQTHVMATGMDCLRCPKVADAFQGRTLFFRARVVNVVRCPDSEEEGLPAVPMDLITPSGRWFHQLWHAFAWFTFVSGFVAVFVLECILLRWCARLVRPFLFIIVPLQQNRYSGFLLFVKVLCTIHFVNINQSLLHRERQNSKENVKVCDLRDRTSYPLFKIIY